MITPEGKWWHTRKFHFLEDHFGLSYQESNLYTELFSLRRRSDEIIKFSGQFRALKTNHVLVSERKLAKRLDLNRRKVQRMMDKLLKTMLIYKIAHSRTDGTIYGITSFEKIPSLSALQVYHMGHYSKFGTIENQRGKNALDTGRWATSGHLAGHLAVAGYEPLERLENTCNAELEPPSGPEVLKKVLKKGIKENFSNFENENVDNFENSNPSGSEMPASQSVGSATPHGELNAHVENEKGSIVSSGLFSPQDASGQVYDQLGVKNDTNEFKQGLNTAGKGLRLVSNRLISETEIQDLTNPVKAPIVRAKLNTKVSEVQNYKINIERNGIPEQITLNSVLIRDILSFS